MVSPLLVKNQPAISLHVGGRREAVAVVGVCRWVAKYGSRKFEVCCCGLRQLIKRGKEDMNNDVVRTRRMKIVRVAWGNVLPSPPVIAMVQEKGKMTLASDDGHIFGQRTLAAVITVIVPPPQILKTKIPRRMMVAMMIELGRTRTLAQDIHHPHMKLVRTHLMRTIHVHMSEYKSTYYMQVTTSRQASTAFLAGKNINLFSDETSHT